MTFLAIYQSSAQSELLIYLSNGKTDGAIGTDITTVRSNTENICRTNTPVIIDQTYSVHALLSIDTDNEIRDMPSLFGFPTDVPIKRADKTTLIADDWDALLNTSNDILLTNIDNSTEFVWTGSNSDGSLKMFNCSNWTSSSSVFGRIGVPMYQDESFLDADDDICSTNNGLYCLAYISPTSPIPTLSQWGIIILGIILAVFGIVAVRNRRMA